MTFLYFWAQRSGKLPYQRLAWRGNSCGDCKGPRGEDLSGGWCEFRLGSTIRLDC